MGAPVLQMRQMVKRVALRKVQQQHHSRQQREDRQQGQTPRQASVPPQRPQPAMQQAQQPPAQQHAQGQHEEGWGSQQVVLHAWDGGADVKPQLQQLQQQQQVRVPTSAAEQPDAVRSGSGSGGGGAPHHQLLEDPHWRQQRLLAVCRHQQKNGLAPDPRAYQHAS